MKDGYYWARDKHSESWEIVEVYGDLLYTMLGKGYVEDYEFGDKIEIPEKYA